MAFDAGMLRCVTEEINSLAPCRIDKIYQPASDEIVLLIRTQNINEKLLINGGSNCPRINITETQAENPAKAPMLCMLLRKHLAGAKMTGARQMGFERVCELEFDAYDEMGYKSKKYLICEIMGKYSNIILADSEHRIIALLRPVDISANSARQLIPGVKYELPPKQDKLDTLSVTKEDFETAVKNAPSGTRCDKFISSAFAGIAISTARELTYLASGDIDTTLENVKIPTLIEEFFKIVDGLKSNSLYPYLVLDESSNPVEYSYIPLHYFGAGYANEKKKSFSELIDTYFLKKSKAERIRQKSSDILRLLTNAESRITKKIAAQTLELKECDSAEEYRSKGDLITSNIYAIKKGAPFVKAIDYSDENMSEKVIELDTRLTPAQNAQRYYKKYAKLKKAKAELAKQIELSKNELEYISTVFDALTRADGETDLAQIREELFHSGYASRMKNYTAVKTGTPHPLKFITSGGYTLLCGKNNTQNDYITTKLADKKDWWFHVKNMPGSHVLMQSGDKEPSERDFTEAAEVAAFYSKAEGNNIAVDYTKVKNVKKPSSSKPGFVIYTSNWTAYVTPDEEKIKKMQVK